MEALFLKVVNLSVTASWVIAAVLLPAVAGGAVSLIVPRIVGGGVQSGAAARSDTAGDCVHHAAGGYRICCGE